MEQQVIIRQAVRADLAGIMALVEALTRYHDDVPRLTLATLERDVF